MQPPGSPFDFGQESDISTRLRSKPSYDAVGQESAVRIVVLRIVLRTASTAEPLMVSARLLALAKEHLRRLGPNCIAVAAAAAKAGMT